jgi:hypothetical protein
MSKIFDKDLDFSDSILKSWGADKHPNSAQHNAIN